MRRLITSAARRALASVLLFLVLGACASKREVVGDQCPSPYSGKATVRGPRSGGANVFGTSCAPCKSAPIKLDKHGCPIFVTFESCGGPVCLGGYQLKPHEEDGGAEADSGAQEDGGAQ